ncbi:hypothetical protein T552_02660 [Pneumocystis carinii B80]|uniref:GPI transamidase component GPI16 n=1 Tax=Pneumocystis carinii (strain B80) TaxID=1408658 RepID=A0A0W4ZE49_PNEC8|nr:hypothetical protein T552_02660 [Pneumocystis carinii B80]KTW26651.1 hypothetical protein T552_02660 [Pneumocystis carinii B80]
MFLRVFFYIFLFFCGKNGALEEEKPFFYEHLFIKPISPKNLLASFRFNTSSDFECFNKVPYSFSGDLEGFFPGFSRLPRSLRYIMEETHTYEVHLRMTRGKWSYKRWGMQPDRGESAGGTGIELWAYIEGDTEEKVWKRWNQLTNGFSGIFSSSIGFMDSTRTIIPVLSFGKEKRNAERYELGGRGYLLYGALPQETICTENLTPFLKLLPCKGRAGISTLLDSHRVFDAEWYSIFLDVIHFCDKDKKGMSSLVQGVDMVLNIERASRRDEFSIPKSKPLSEISCDKTRNHIKEDLCFPLDNSSNIEWSLSKLFGRPIQRSCSLDFALSEVVTVAHPYERVISPTPSTILVEENVIFSKYMISEPFLDITMASQTSDVQFNATSAPLFVERFLTRKNQINVIISNPHSKEFQIIYLEVFPWFMKPFIHTLNGRILSSNVRYPLNFEDIYFRPSIDRKRGSYFELRMHIPSNSTIEIVWEFEKMLLRYAEYPPDPNRGVSIAPSILTVFNAGDDINKIDPIAVIRTTSLLLTLLTPDFSMPYNVIVLTSSIIAMLFGSMFNLLTRRFVSLEEAKKMKIMRLNVFVFNLKAMLKKMFS